MEKLGTHSYVDNYRGAIPFGLYEEPPQIRMSFRMQQWQHFEHLHTIQEFNHLIANENHIYYIETLAILFIHCGEYGFREFRGVVTSVNREVDTGEIEVDAMLNNLNTEMIEWLKNSTNRNINLNITRNISPIRYTGYI